MFFSDVSPIVGRYISNFFEHHRIRLGGRNSGFVLQLLSVLTDGSTVSYVRVTGPLLQPTATDSDQSPDAAPVRGLRTTHGGSGVRGQTAAGHGSVRGRPWSGVHRQTAAVSRWFVVPRRTVAAGPWFVRHLSVTGVTLRILLRSHLHPQCSILQP